MDNENNFTEGNNLNQSNDGGLKTSNFKKNKLVIIAGVVVLLFALIGGGAYAIINSNPKVKVFNALKATSEELKNKETLTDKIAGKDYQKKLQEKGINQNMKFTINSTNMPELASLKGMGISLDSSMDQKNKKLMLNVGGEYKGTSIVKAQFYTDNKKLMLTVPELYNSWFTCDAENIQTQYNNSVFAQQQKLPNQEISFQAFGKDGDVILNEEFFKEVLTSYLSANGDKLATIGKNIKVEKSKEAKEIEIGGAKEKCTGYDVVISGQDAKIFIESIYDYILQDEKIKKVITQQVRYSYMQQNKKYASPEAMVDDMFAEMKKVRDEFDSKVTFDDVNTKIYLDKKGRAISIEANTAMTDDAGKKVEVKYTNDFKGKDNIGDIMDMSMELENNGDKVKIDLDNTSVTKDDTMSEEMKLVLASNKDKFNFNLKSNYNLKSGSFDGAADINADGQGVTLNYNGNGKFDKSSSKLDLDFDKLDLNMNINRQKVNISLGGSYSMAPIDKPIEEPTGEKLEVFNLSQDKLVSIVNEIQNNAMKIAGSLR